MPKYLLDNHQNAVDPADLEGERGPVPPVENEAPRDENCSSLRTCHVEYSIMGGRWDVLVHVMTYCTTTTSLLEWTVYLAFHTFDAYMSLMINVAAAFPCLHSTLTRVAVRS